MPRIIVLPSNAAPVSWGNNKISNISPPKPKTLTLQEIRALSKEHSEAASQRSSTNLGLQFQALTDKKTAI